jgi:hypothetical protein
MIGRDYGDEPCLAFLDEVDRGAYRLEPSGARTSPGPGRSWAPTPHLPGFGIADASNVVLAERYSTRDVLTTDQQDFRQIRLPGGRFFRSLPYDL